MKDRTDICSRRHGGADTSTAAFNAIADHRWTLTERVLHEVRRLGQATCEQIAQMLDISLNTASPRFTELKAAGLIYDTGRRVKNKFGRAIRVYAPTFGERRLTLL